MRKLTINNSGQDVTGLQFGDSRYYFEDESLKKYMKLFGFLREKGYLTEDATINFRHCFLGMEQNKWELLELSHWTKGNVTGVDGWILPFDMKLNKDKGDKGRKMNHEGVLVNWYFLIIDYTGPDYAPYKYNRKDPRAQLSSYSRTIYNKETGLALWKAGKVYDKGWKYPY